MYRFIEYAIFFVVLMALQVFLFDNLNLGMYVYPMAYVAFVLLLPMETRPVWVLLLGLLTGVVVDAATGSAGLNTIAMLATAFLRRPVMTAVAGKDSVGEGGIPCSDKIGTGKFFRYAAFMAGIHCIIYFGFETLTMKYIYLTLIRTALSWAVTVGLVWLTQYLFAGFFGAGSTRNA